MAGCKSSNFSGSTKIEGTSLTVNEIIAKEQKEERNKKNVQEFFQLLMGDHDYKAAEKYMGEYIQHDPNVKGNGMAPLKEYLTTNQKFKKRPKGVKLNFAQVIADGDFVNIQIRKDFSKINGTKTMVQHIFRLNEDGKIEEHWSTAATVSITESKNPQPLF